MKLSDVRGERVFDVIADLVEPVAAIATSKEVKELRKGGTRPKNMTPEEYALRKIRKSVPSLIRSHKGDAVLILSTIEGVTPEEYTEGLTLQKLIADASELMSDEVFMDFLASAAPPTE